MPFWSSQTIKTRFPSENIINVRNGFQDKHIQHGSYEMCLGSEVYVTSDSQKRMLSEAEQVTIPAGQFALLLTEERIHIPNDCLGFISIKANKKFCGLVNVSGFHVDPGYDGKLKFSVYNAGSRDVILTRGKPLFVLWIANFDDAVSDPYVKETNNEITDEDIMKIQGEIASPGNLLSRLRQIENFISMAKTIFTTGFIALLVAILGGLLVNAVSDKMKSTPVPPQSQDTTQRQPGEGKRPLQK
jgi:dCTP deaminase